MPARIEVYRFQELDRLAQRRVLEEHRYINVQYNWWELLKQQFIERLATLGYLNAEPRFSGFYCKGDGASFSATVDIPVWVKHHKGSLKAGFILIRNSADYISICIQRTSVLYYHEYTMHTHIDYSYLSKKALDRLPAFEQAVLEDARQLAREYYAQLEAEYAYLTSDKAVSNTLNLLNWHFTDKGARV